MEANQAVYERDAEVYSDLSLVPSERRILSLLADRWPEINMLDVGIGAGRTTYTFAALAGRYVGVDYSPRMIELAKRLVGEKDKRVELIVADARDSSFLQEPFDFILFSYNGLDSVDHEDRLKILTELRRLLKPDGSFLFSAHSINALPLVAEKPRDRSRSWLRTIYVWLAYIGQLRLTRKVNSKLDLETAWAQGWTIIRDGAHGFKMRIYYVDPMYQVEQLRDVGFEKIAVYDAAGREVDAKDAGRDPWLHYYCRPA